MPNPRTPPPWRRAFLRELARTGSVEGAAEHCGICKTTAYQLRKNNPSFAVSWERAQAKARESFGDAPGRRPVLRPNETIRSSKSGKTCVMRTGPGRWSASKEALFLAELTATANVRAAARAAGVSTTAAYNRRKLWPAFAAEWHAAVAEGWARIETLVVCAATTTLDPEPLPERAYEEPRMSMELAVKVWLALNGRQRGDKRRPGRPVTREPDIEEVRQEILRKVAAIKRARTVTS